LGKEIDRSAYFCSVNWGKKSVAIDLNSPEGKLQVQKLASQSDLIIASYKPGDAEKLGVSYDQLRTTNEKLIYGQITGYGTDTDRVGYDAVIQAESGFMDLNGEAHGNPTKMPVALIDVLAGHQLKEGLLLALLKKERTGAGNFVEVSLIQTAIASLTNQATNWLVANQLPARQGSAHPNIAPYGDSFVTKDGKRILLAVGNDKQFNNLISILPEHAIDMKNFSTNRMRVSSRTELNILLSAAIIKMESSELLKQIHRFKIPAGIKMESSELLKQIHRFKIPAGIIQNVKEVFAMNTAKDLLIKADSLTGVRTYVGKNSAPFTEVNLLPPPHFGEHTQEIIAQLSNT